MTDRIMHRRGILGLLASAPIIAACGTADGPRAPTAARRPATLDFLHADGPPQKEKLERIAEGFKAKNAGSQINVIYTPWGEFETKIVALHTAGTPPDFHQIDDDAVPFFAMRDLLLPADALLKEHAINRGDYHKMIWDLTTVQGKVMALTLALKPRAYLYNRDLFDQAGIKAPTTWAQAWSADQLQEHARKLTQGDVWGYMWDYWIWDSIPAMNGGDHFSPTWTEYLIPRYADAYQWIADLAYKQRVAPPPDVRRQPGGERQMFTNGKLAIWNTTISVARQLNDAKDLRWDVMPVAKLLQSAKAEASLFTFSMAKATKDPAGTAAFASYFMTDAAQEIMAEGGDLMPVKTSVQNSKAFLDPARQPQQAKVWIESLEHQGRWPFLYNGIELRDEVRPAVDLIWNGQAQAKEALEGVRPRIMELLKVSQEKMNRR